MDAQDFHGSDRGRVRRTLEGYLAFFPARLPRSVDLQPDLVGLLDSATGALHRLGGVGLLLPNPMLLIAPHVRLEAVLSSRIEGTQATLSDLLRLEADDPDVLSRPGDVIEVRNYVTALDRGLDRIREGFPLSLRLLREIHHRLLAGVRGHDQRPGEFRASQNWIGPPGCTIEAATFVPPPVDEMHDALRDWEAFLHERRMPLLVQLALAHYQLEVIHPFPDGNGRVGRLLIPLTLCERDVLPHPLLYLSVYFERHRRDYYRHLLDVSQTGDLTPWIAFFLEGVLEQARDAERRTVRLVELQHELRTTLLEAKASPTALRVAERLFARPYVSATGLQRELDITWPTAQKAISDLEERGMLREITGRRRHRLYYAEDIFRAVYDSPEEDEGDDDRSSAEWPVTEAEGEVPGQQRLTSDQ